MNASVTGTAGDRGDRALLARSRACSALSVRCALGAGACVIASSREVRAAGRELSGCSGQACRRASTGGGTRTLRRRQPVRASRPAAHGGTPRQFRKKILTSAPRPKSPGRACRQPELRSSTSRHRSLVSAPRVGGGADAPANRAKARVDATDTIVASSRSSRYQTGMMFVVMRLQIQAQHHFDKVK